MARFRHISTKLVLVLDAGTENGKKARKRVTISNIREDASTDALWELAEALGKLLAHPVAEVRLYKEEAVEREETDGAAPENDGVNKEADDNKNAGTAWADGDGKSGLLSHSCNDGYSPEPRLSVFRPSNNRALRAALSAVAAQAFEPCQKGRETMLRAATAANTGTRRCRRYGERSVAIQAKTPPLCGIPPPLRENIEDAKKRPVSIYGFIADIIGRETAVVISPAGFWTGSPHRCAARDDDRECLRRLLQCPECRARNGCRD